VEHVGGDPGAFVKTRPITAFGFGSALQDLTAWARWIGWSADLICCRWRRHRTIEQGLLTPSLVDRVVCRVLTRAVGRGLTTHESGG